VLGVLRVDLGQELLGLDDPVASWIEVITVPSMVNAANMLITPWRTPL